YKEDRNAKPDPDLREFRRQMALSSIGKRASPQKGKSRSNVKASTSKESKPLFLDDPEEPTPNHPSALREEEIDSAFAIAIHESLEEAEAEELRQAIEESKKTTQPHHRIGESSNIRPTTISGNVHIASAVFEEEEDPLGAPGQREPSTSTEGDRDAPFMGKVAAASMLFGLPTMGGKASLKIAKPADSDEEDPFGSPQAVKESEDESMEEVALPSHLPSTAPSGQSLPIDSDSDDMEEVIPTHVGTVASHQPVIKVQDQVPNVLSVVTSDSDDDMEEVELLPSVVNDERKVRLADTTSAVDRSPDAQELVPHSNTAAASASHEDSYGGWEVVPSTIGEKRSPLQSTGLGKAPVSPQAQAPKSIHETVPLQTLSHIVTPTVKTKTEAKDLDSPRGSDPAPAAPAAPNLAAASNHSPVPLPLPAVSKNVTGIEEGDPAWSWSRTPTPEPGAGSEPAVATDSAQPHRPGSPSNVEGLPVEESFDAADEIDLLAEEGDFANL
ncbi:hypothetical protein FRC00_014728, partial [Tulasnella sp. 408]